MQRSSVAAATAYTDHGPDHTVRAGLGARCNDHPAAAGVATRTCKVQRTAWQALPCTCGCARSCFSACALWAWAQRRKMLGPKRFGRELGVAVSSGRVLGVPFAVAVHDRAQALAAPLEVLRQLCEQTERGRQRQKHRREGAANADVAPVALRSADSTRLLSQCRPRRGCSLHVACATAYCCTACNMLRVASNSHRASLANSLRCCRACSTRRSRCVRSRSTSRRWLTSLRRHSASGSPPCMAVYVRSAQRSTGWSTASARRRVWWYTAPHFAVLALHCTALQCGAVPRSAAQHGAESTTGAAVRNERAGGCLFTCRPLRTVAIGRALPP